MFEFKKIAPATFEIPKTGRMKVPGLVIATEELLKQTDINEALQQLCNVAYLPGILGHSIAMPDMHWGYGFPIGGVAATQLDGGVISPGGVGYDINCGVRMAIIPIEYKTIKKKHKDYLLATLFKNVPSGIGKGSKNKTLTNEDFENLCSKGAKWSIEHGFGFHEDLLNCESYGCIDGANIEAVSHTAKQRGADQLGTIGSGNHFVEIGEIQAVYDEPIANAWNVHIGKTYVLIHSGSRGFGHQICQDTLNDFVIKDFAKGLPDAQLVATPIQSKEGEKYFQAMAAAANFAFNNRQRILHGVRISFKEVLNIAPEEISLVYDVCHNIAKFEKHIIDNKLQTVCVHRKGATRAFAPGSIDLPEHLKGTGQPVLVPGDMGRASYLMAGLGNPLTYASACHGAGRARSRHQSAKLWRNKDPLAYMETKGVHVKANSLKTIIEEMPDAYKDVDLVVEAVEIAKLAKKIARMKPSLVIKG